ncbi:MAG TPA: hypothetical protein VE817_08505 [Candidatus Acidoferrum sp.]|nr:hypothetical protein [Candidatus Acidoferrum sp.]
MTDRLPGAPDDEPKPDIEPEATEVAAVPETAAAGPETASAGPETDVGAESADDEMVHDADTTAPAEEPGSYEEPSPEDFEDDAEDDGELDEPEFADDNAALGAEADDEVLETATGTGAGAAAARGPRLGGRLGRAPAAALTPSERAVHISDRASQVFVLAATLTFVVILLYALFAGAGGFLTPLPTPTPEVSESPSGSPSVSPSVSVSPSGSASSSPSVSGSGSPPSSASPSLAAPSTSPSPP